MLKMKVDPAMYMKTREEQKIVPEKPRRMCPVGRNFANPSAQTCRAGRTSAKKSSSARDAENGPFCFIPTPFNLSTYIRESISNHESPPGNAAGRERPPSYRRSARNDPGSIDQAAFQSAIDTAAAIAVFLISHVPTSNHPEVSPGG
jgi:hypothetical protein